MKWLPPQLAAVAKRLGLLARKPVSGFIAGRHRSTKKGASPEFAEHREYAPGDDLRNLDWKVLARKDRYFVKQYADETNLRATVVLDCSGSMAFAGECGWEHEGRRLSKFDYARHLAAGLAATFAGQQDGVGLVTFAERVLETVPARARRSQMQAVLEAIDRAEPKGETAPAAVFHEIAERIPRRGMVAIVSDLLDPDVGGMLKALHHFRARGHEVAVFHVLAEEEVAFPYDSRVCFENLEGGGADLRLDARAVRANYLAQVEKYLAAVSQGCGRMGADYVPVNTKEPFARALGDYLSKRVKR